jgi:putative hydrolase of the HAD superfamily
MPLLKTSLRERPRAVLFDIGRVIIRIRLSQAFDEFGAPDGLSAEQVWEAIQADPRWPDWQEGRMTPREYHAHLRGKFHLRLSFEEFRDAWNRVLDPVTILPQSLFEGLSQSCRLALLSNTDPIHVERMETSYGFIQCFPVRVYSCSVGASKPGPAIYQRALRDVGVCAREALYIDDILENVTAAADLGMAGFHFTSAAELLTELSQLRLIPV